MSQKKYRRGDVVIINEKAATDKFVKYAVGKVGYIANDTDPATAHYSVRFPISHRTDYFYSKEIDKLTTITLR